jgi:hypothetical protein
MPEKFMVLAVLGLLVVFVVGRMGGSDCLQAISDNKSKMPRMFFLRIRGDVINTI